MNEVQVPAPEFDRLARAALSRVSEPGHPRMTDAVHEFGAGAVLEGLRTQATVWAADLSAREGGRPVDVAELLAGARNG